jgi:hypothetical protein
MSKIYFALFILFAVSIPAAAQCSGVYFKDLNRQLLSNGFAYSYVEDFDNDGLNDIFGFKLTEGGNLQIYYYKRLSATSFDTTSRNTVITNARGVFVFGDVNNDGKKDLIITHSVNQQMILTTYLNDGTGRFLTTTPAVNVDNNETFYVAGDLNNDGKADVLSTIQNGGNSTLYYRLAQPDNSFGAATQITTFPSFLAYGAYIHASNSSIFIEDLNNDGLKDIAYTPYATNTLRVLTNQGNAAFTETVSSGFWQSSSRLKSVDLNADGKKDFVSAPVNDPNAKIKILANDGNNSFTVSETSIPPEYVGAYNEGVDYVTGDFDADGKADIIVPGAKKYLFLKNQGNFTFTPQEFKSYLNIKLAELIDGDAKTDIISINRPFIDGYQRLQTPNALFSLYSAVRFRRNVCNPVGQTKTVDFNGDGFTDRAFWNPSTGVWRYYTDNTQNNQVYFQWGSGAAGDVPVPQDYDGDGQTDYAVFRKSDGNWWIVRSSDGQVVTFKFGITEDKPIPADYDGDGRADFAVFRPSEGNWYVWLSQSNQFYAAHFGLSEDKPLPADYDGDGKADICVFRPSTGVWYRTNSSDNSFFAVQYGVADDKPVPADFDEDGKANIAVFRNGAWYVLKNDFSTYTFYWGTANDIPFLGYEYQSAAFVYRKTASAIYTTIYAETFPGTYTTYSTGNSFNETFVSTVLPAE